MNNVEKSIIDFVIVSDDLVENFLEIVIDDERRHVLTRLTRTKSGIVKRESDHNTIR